MSDNNKRKSESFKVRIEAAKLARDRCHPEHRNNGDEKAEHHYMMNFSKGLAHNSTTGLVSNLAAFKGFRKAIDDGLIDPFTSMGFAGGAKKRKWEAPTAGFVHSLQGPDAQAVTMPPAPALGSDELAYEMAEVYELALLRDVSLSKFSPDGTAPELTNAIDRLNDIGYSLEGGARNFPIGHPSVQGFEKQRPRTNTSGKLDAQTAFRGSSPGVDVGPYLSQFLLIGNNALPGGGAATDGLIQYGAQQICQKVPVAHVGKDYMITWQDWLEVQNGADKRNNATLFSNQEKRFITTPRDLATYVHDDALYQAYLNALLIMLPTGTPFNPELPFDLSFERLSGRGPNSMPLQAGGFALWGGPHILSLVTEVATRALKAVRWQKFNNHLRLRPEALAARIYKADAIKNELGISGFDPFNAMASKIDATLQAVLDSNTNALSKGEAKGAAKGKDSGKVDATTLLPMAFQEGSPMHPSYGAGHATVAGACVTILKAFLKGDEPLDVTGKGPHKAYVASEDGRSLCDVDVIDAQGKGRGLTVNGELNKLAANISIGRNMAGVHYYSDYFDSLRMGEAIAIGILEEQALCYPKDEFTLTLETFDGQNLTIHRSGVF